MDRWTGTAASIFFASSIACITCVARGSRVRTPDGLRPIEDLEVGDEVFSVDPETGELVATEITAIRSAERECLQLACNDKAGLVCTSDHPVYDPEAEEYADAGDWIDGDRSSLLVVDGEAVETRRVDRREMFVGVRQVFDLTVDSQHHNFIAGDVVVHNKSPPADECRVNGNVETNYSECTCSDGRKGNVQCPPEADSEAPHPKGRCICNDAGVDADAEGDGDTSSGDATEGDATYEDGVSDVSPGDGSG